MSVVEIIGAIVTVIGAITGTGYFSFAFAKKKYLQEVEKLKVEVLQAQKTAETTEIENGTKVVDLYKNALDDLNDRYEKKYQELEASSNKKLAALDELYKQKEAHLMKEIEFHAKQSALFEKMYKDEVKKHNLYKRNHP